MEEKNIPMRSFDVRQETWRESPCSSCHGTPCCRNLPLAAIRLDSRNDFITLLLLSTYNGFFPVLKKGGEWTVYLGRDCRFLNSETGMCSIHGESHQSLICKSYDAHNCWYINAFNHFKYTTMIPFNTNMLIWLDQKYGIMEQNCDVSIDWDTLCQEAFDYGKCVPPFESQFSSPIIPRILPFSESRTDQYLFLPPYSLLKDMKHFELLSFRLGFPGLYVAATDSHWTFIIKTSQNELLLKRIRDHYFPSIEHSHIPFSFEGISRSLQMYSGLGEKWLILGRRDIDTVKALALFDSRGTIKRLPTCHEILQASKKTTPDRAA